MLDYPAPGGEPLWRSSLRPREFRRNTNPAETRKNRRLPGTTERFVALRPGVNELSQGQIIALDYSREPPVATFRGRMKH